MMSCVGVPSWPGGAWRIPLLRSRPPNTHVRAQVPITLYLMTHGYFCFYHVVSNVLLRRVREGERTRARAGGIHSQGTSLALATQGRVCPAGGHAACRTATTCVLVHAASSCSC